MNTRALPFFALPFLLGACSGVMQTTAQMPDAPAPVRVADRDSKWGKRPSYDDSGQYFVMSGRNLMHNLMDYGTNAPIHGTPTVDVLLNRDGTSRAALLVQSSGNDAVDAVAVDLLRHARYSLRLGPDDPAPYVVRKTLALRIPATGRAGHTLVDTSDLTGSGPQPDFSGLGVHTNYSYTTQTTSEPK